MLKPPHRQAVNVSGNLQRTKMKSFKKILFRLFKFGLIVVLTIYVGLFLYFQFSWSNHYPKTQVDNLITSINKTKALPDSFYLVYDKVYKDRHEKITIHFLKNFWTDPFIAKPFSQRRNWQLITAGMQKFNGYRYKIAPMALAFKINRHASPEKCFDFTMTRLYSDYTQKFNLNNDIDNLGKTNNIIDFIIAIKGPSHSKTHHPTRYKKDVDSLKKIVFTD